MCTAYILPTAPLAEEKAEVPGATAQNRISCSLHSKANSVLLR
jgi:hypothetical protein